MTLRRRLVRTLSAVAAATLLVPLAQAPAGAAPKAAPSGAYLALGDSVAAGVGAGAAGGYVQQLAERISRKDSCGAGAAVGCRVVLEDVSVSGATTLTLIADQLPLALQVLVERNQNASPADDVRLITLTIGGNDLFRPIVAACGTLTLACLQTVQQQLGQLAAGYQTILSQLRAAAGPGTTIAVMTYYNALVGTCPLPDALIPLADVVLEGGSLGPATLPAGANDVIRSAAAAFGAVVVETAAVVGAAQLAGDCLHPNASGHAAIASQFEAAVGGLVGGRPGRR